MGKFNTKKLIQAHPSQIGAMAEAIRSEFQSQGFDVMVEDTMSGGKDISITRGNMFMAFLGMKSALKVTLMPQPDGVFFEAGAGIFGQQAIPTIISMFYLWPVLLTQIWGLIQQSKLDDKALEIAESTVSTAPSGSTAALLDPGFKFCTNCGNKMSKEAKFCSNCGKQLD